MANRIIVFPVQGSKWAFGAIASSTDAAGTRRAADTFRNLWHNVTAAKRFHERAELLTHYVSEKMHQKWVTLGKAPQGSLRNRVHRMGERLLARISPSEYFLKSVPKDAASLEIIFPSSLSPRLVRRRVRHIAKSGTKFHGRYMFGSFALLPLTTLFGVVPVPNIPLFWNLFRVHAHWRALQGSKRLLQLVSDNCGVSGGSQQLVFFPCEKLESMVLPMQVRTQAISDTSIAAICHQYSLDYTQMLKWRTCKANRVEWKMYSGNQMT